MNSKVDEYLYNLPEPQQTIAKQLRQMLFSLVPGVEERFSFKLPFYHYFGMFCYINAVPDGIDLAFCRGKDLVSEFPALEAKDRAIVATITLNSLKDIHSKEVREVIISAALWNEEAKKKKIPMVKKKNS